MGSGPLCSSCVGAAWPGYTPGDGPMTARLLILGEAPGKEEILPQPDGVCHPFVGPSGYHLNKPLMGERDLVRVDNCRRCKSPGADADGEKGESKDEFARSTEYCSEVYLGRWLVNLVECRTILCVGADALREIVGITPASFHHKKGGGLARLVGSTWSREEVIAIRAACRSDSPPLPLPPKLHSVVASIHPAAALRGSRHLMPTIYQMIQRARNLSLQETF